MTHWPKGSKILVIGSGPIVIGQACEFDYSGTQACRVLRQAGYQVVLVNSNPATIMTDFETADRIYIEPLDLKSLELIIERERPQALIPTLGGQTALNLGLQLEKQGVLKKWGVTLLGSSVETIELTEDREKFRDVLQSLGVGFARSVMVRSLSEAETALKDLGLPLILRPNYTLGGSGGGVAYTEEEYFQLIRGGLQESMTHEVLVEESILGWYEYELEIMRDHKGTAVIVCSVENIDPCGVHTGDSVTVAPQMTLPDHEYQKMRFDALRIAEAVGLRTGGANIQFAVCPKTRRQVVIEMNPRVSRSSALASKATGFPIAKIAALLSVGYTLDEITNDITKKTPSSFEPALDYVVVKIPKFAFDKFPGSEDILTTSMKSVGEVMALGRTFVESFMKALAALEDSGEACPQVPLEENKLSVANSKRFLHIFQALRQGYSIERLHELSGIHPFFLRQFQRVVELEQEVARYKGNKLPESILRAAKRVGLSDARIAALVDASAQEILQWRENYGVLPDFQRVDTCAGEFESQTPYFYSTYWGSPHRTLKENLRNPVLIMGSGPNRIGQGIEFDYACVRANMAFRKLGYTTIMVNSNPETVSTDYDTSDILFFEPLTSEHVREVMRFTGARSFCASFGGQTALKLSYPLVAQGYQIIGSSLEVIDQTEDRSRFAEICTKWGLKVPRSTTASSVDEAFRRCEDIGYPVILRPSHVLGGRRMAIVESSKELEEYFNRHHDFPWQRYPIYIDQFLDRALEVDVDVICDGSRAVVCGVLEHIEWAGVHSGDSMAVIPAQRLEKRFHEKILGLAQSLAVQLGVRGLLNLQFALKEGEIYILEANPRSSRTVPFLAKACGYPLVDLSVQAMVGTWAQALPDYLFRKTRGVFVKGVVYPFKKIRASNPILSPEMKSTGEVMGWGKSYAEALDKAFISQSMPWQNRPKEVLFSLRDKDKEECLELAQVFHRLGWRLVATAGTAKFLSQKGLPVEPVKKVGEGRPNCVDRIQSGQVGMVVNTTSGGRSTSDGYQIRRACIDYNVPIFTRLETAWAIVEVLEGAGEREVRPLLSEV